MAKKKTATKGKLAKSQAKAKAPAKKAKAVTRKRAAKTAAKSARKKPPLPRPTITADEKLFLLFKDDYHARQIFDFLRVDTVRELEEFAPDEIVKRLSRPIADSVDRIRRRLAEKHRYLSGDEEFLIDVLRRLT